MSVNTVRTKLNKSGGGQWVDQIPVQGLGELGHWKVGTRPVNRTTDTTENIPSPNFLGER